MTVAAFTLKDEPGQYGNVVDSSDQMIAFWAVGTSHEGSFRGHTIDDNVKEGSDDEAKDGGEDEVVEIEHIHGGVIGVERI